MKAKKEYGRPEMTVVELRHSMQLLQGSPDGLTSPNNYEDGGDPFAES